MAGLVLAGGAVAALYWPSPSERTARGKRLIDAALPRYEFYERHQTRICAPPERISAAVKQVSPDEIRWLGLLSWIRGIDSPLDANFVSLADTADEVVLGTGGEFWRYQPVAEEKLSDVKGDPAGFAVLDLGGRPKAVVNFAIGRAPFGCSMVTTETRIHVPDLAMRGKFAAYWRVIQPGSALLRRAWLDAIRRRAEAK